MAGEAAVRADARQGGAGQARVQGGEVRPGGADEGAAGGAVPGDVPRLLPDHLLRGEEDGRRT